MKYIDEVDIKNKTIILRVDFNVPIKEGKITDDFRIVSSLKTINYLLDNNCKIIILSHLGRVKTEEDKNKNSLKIVYNKLKTLLNANLVFSEELEGKKFEDKVLNLKNQEVLLLENTRFLDLFNKRESNCDLEISKYWSSFGDVFVNDAFGTVHRKHASNYGISKYLPTCYGFLIKKEVEILNEFVKDNQKTIIMGGAKVKDKINLIESLSKSSSKILIGGKMCFTFMYAKGNNVDKSLVEESELENVKKVLIENVNKIILPIDLVDNLDIGVKTIEFFKQNINKDFSLVWNGPMGYVEEDKYLNGTYELLKYLEKEKIKTLIAGGDTVKVANKYNMKFYHISSGGGATLEYLEQKTLPGLLGRWDK